MNKWDEKNYIRQKTNSLSSNEQEPSDITISIKSDSTQPLWKDTGGIKMWRRICPECNKDIWTKSKCLIKSKCLCQECGYKLNSRRTKVVYTEEELSRKCPKCRCQIFYKEIKAKRVADRKMTVCKSCQSNQTSEAYKGKSFEERLGKNKAKIVKRKISQSNKGRIFSQSTRQLISEHRKEYYKKNPFAASGKNNPMHGIHRYGKNNPNYRQNWSEERKDAARVSSAIPHRYNKNACLYLNKLSEEMGWNLQHAENGGEYLIKRYFVDGYDKERNIVVEYDERHHYSGGKLKQKDIDRMNKIIQYTGCRFYRYNERTKELKLYDRGC
jgi:hypothetical protein